jgi:hypothetical protein
MIRPSKIDLLCNLETRHGSLGNVLVVLLNGHLIRVRLHDDSGSGNASTIVFVCFAGSCSSVRRLGPDAPTPCGSLCVLFAWQGSLN